MCQLPSNGSAHPHDQTVAKDTAYVQQQLLQILDQGQDAVLVLHSYAGVLVYLQPTQHTVRAISDYVHSCALIEQLVGECFCEGLHAHGLRLQSHSLLYRCTRWHGCTGLE